MSNNKQRNKRIMRPRFNFAIMKISSGEYIELKETSYKAEVISGRTVKFNGREYSLTRLTKDRGGETLRSPIKYWHYKGKPLHEIYDETYPKSAYKPKA